MLPASSSEPLRGGNTHESIVRVGGTVRRPAGPWTSAVHALLEHLETAGFAAAPRALGLDSDGREVLTYAAGEVVWPDHFARLESDEALAEIARLIRSYHDVAATFVPPAGAQWWDLAADPTGASEVVCHNDLAPWNLVRGADGGWTFIDWDLAAPGRRSWDLGWALLSFIPLTPDRPLEEEATVRRLRVFMEAYGAPAELESVLHAAVERGEHEAARIRELGEQGREPFVRIRNEGHAEIWAGAAEHVSANASRWASRAAQPNVKE
jgi:aminoglycoside phosphotransferase (APT) family kinase protein